MVEHDAIRLLLEACEAMTKTQLPAHRLGQHGLHVLLRQIDHERKAGLALEHRKLNRSARLAGLTVDVADLVNPHAAAEHGRGDAEPAPNLE
jgi:hypothetical protein